MKQLKRFSIAAALSVAPIIFPLAALSADLDPQPVGSYNTSGTAFDVVVEGNYAYVADANAGLQAIDISNPADPQRVGCHNTGGYAFGVAVSGSYAYVADASDGLQVIELFRLAALRLEPLAGLDGGTFRFQLRGESGQTVRVQRSTDLIAWTDWQSINLSGAPAMLSDTNAAIASVRFYRAVSP